MVENSHKRYQGGREKKKDVLRQFGLSAGLMEDPATPNLARVCRGEGRGKAALASFLAALLGEGERKRGRGERHIPLRPARP